MSICHCPSGAGDESTDVIGSTWWFAGGVIGGKIGEAGMRTGWQGCFWLSRASPKRPILHQPANHDPTNAHLAPPWDGLPGGAVDGKIGVAQQ